MDKNNINSLFKMFEDNYSSSQPNAGSNVNDMARKMAQSIKKQLGVSEESITKTTRSLIIQLAKQQQPNLSNEELEKIVDMMMPGAKQKEIWKKLPKEVIMSMIDNILLFSVGQLPEEELRSLPKNWMQNYISIFPPELTKLISAFLRDEVETEMFRAAVNYIIDRR